MSKFYNITGATGVTVELIAPSTSIISIQSVLLTNVHDTNAATVTLFIQNRLQETYNLIHTIAVPADSSLLLDESTMFNFPKQFGLYITVGSSDTVDVIIGT